MKRTCILFCLIAFAYGDEDANHGQLPGYEHGVNAYGMALPKPEAKSPQADAIGIRKFNDQWQIELGDKGKQERLVYTEGGLRYVLVLSESNDLDSLPGDIHIYSAGRPVTTKAGIAKFVKKGNELGKQFPEIAKLLNLPLQMEPRVIAEHNWKNHKIERYSWLNEGTRYVVPSYAVHSNKVDPAHIHIDPAQVKKYYNGIEQRISDTELAEVLKKFSSGI